jgi:hypothetical protein
MLEFLKLVRWITELIMVPDKLAIEDKYLAVYPIGEPLTVLDEQVIETRPVKREVDNDDPTELKGKLQLQELMIIYSNA